jgi:hypothetical protein
MAVAQAGALAEMGVEAVAVDIFASFEPSSPAAALKETVGKYCDG